MEILRNNGNKKLYKKDNKYMGCGDFTIDTLEGMNKLVSKESTIKDFTI